MMPEIIAASDVGTEFSPGRCRESDWRFFDSHIARNTTVAKRIETAIELPITVVWRCTAKVVAPEAFETHFEQNGRMKIDAFGFDRRVIVLKNDNIFDLRPMFLYYLRSIFHNVSRWGGEV